VLIGNVIVALGYLNQILLPERLGQGHERALGLVLLVGVNGDVNGGSGEGEDGGGKGERKGET